MVYLVIIGGVILGIVSLIIRLYLYLDNPIKDPDGEGRFVTPFSNKTDKDSRQTNPQRPARGDFWREVKINPSEPEGEVSEEK